MGEMMMVDRASTAPQRPTAFATSSTSGQAGESRATGSQTPAIDNLKTIIDAGVASAKPLFTDISADRLVAWLRAQPDLSDTCTVGAIRGSGEKTGASSGIVLFDLIEGDEARPMVLRYAPMSNPLRIFHDYNVAGQFNLQRALHADGLPVPNARWVDPEGVMLGLPGFVMDAVSGQVADGSAFTGGLFADCTDERRAVLLDEVIRTQHRIHQTDWRALGIERDVCAAAGRTPIERYIAWFWQTAEWIQPTQLERLTRVRDWLIRNQPDYHRDDYRLVHGDPGLGNYMFRDDRIVAIIDWELAGIAHPTYDVAMHCSLSNFFRDAATPEVARIIPTDDEWIASYQRITGSTVADIDYFRKFVTLPALIVSLSMNRGMPAEMREPHLAMLESMWSQAEAA